MSVVESATGQRGVVLFGSRGQLGSAILAALGRSRPDCLIRTVAWEEVGADSLAALLHTRVPCGGPGCDFIFANGVTDPRLPLDEIRRSNLEFPQQVVEATTNGKPHRYLTFGTVHETFPALCAANPYFGSKRQLGIWMAQLAQRNAGDKVCRFMHVRLHTIYGSAPKGHMFLGQMLTSLQNGTPFCMSSGEQLREYHHADDIAVAITGILARRWDFGPVIELSSGNPVRLVDLAQQIFRTFGREELLQIGALTGAEGENKDWVFPASPTWLLPASRESVEGMIALLQKYLEL